MTKSKTPWPCAGCGALLSGKGGKRYCGPDCRPRCLVDACEEPRHGLTYCSAHHARWKRHGDPLAPKTRRAVKGLTCSVGDCELPMRKHPYCANHYAMWTQYGEIREWKYKWAAVGGACAVCAAPVLEGTGRRKYCSPGCQQADHRTGGERPTEGFCTFCDKPFSLIKRTASGRLQRIDTIWCPDCGRDSPDVQRFKRYGVTREEYRAATARGCTICLRTDRPLHVDHDHACCPVDKRCCGKCVRGFICGPCNRGLGLFFDDPAALERAARYLQRQLD